MPDKHIPPDWWLALYDIFWTAVAGMLGAVVRQLSAPKKGWMNRILEWVSAAICAVYMTPTLSHIMIKMLNKYDLIEQSIGLNVVNVTGLAGLLSGAVGITLIESIIIFIRKRTGANK